MIDNSEMTKVNIHYHLGNELDIEKGEYTHTADRTFNNYKSFDKQFNLCNAKKELERAIELRYGIFAVTNSNVIHSEEIEKLIGMFSSRITIIPGVEINLKNSDSEKDKFLHVVILFDPTDMKKVHDKAQLLETMIKENTKPYLNFEQFVKLVSDKDLKCIIAAHGIKQGKRSSENNANTFSELIGMDDVIPVLVEDGKEFHKEQLKIRLKNKLSISNKDLKWLEESSSISALDRLEIGTLSNPDYIWGGNSFDDLFFASLMGGHRILKESDIVPRKNYIKTIKFKNSDNTQINEGEINLSYGLNTIVGASGSGKTLLLEILYSKLKNKSLINKTISSKTDYKEIYNENDIIILDENGNEINFYSNYNVYEGKNLYNEIIQTYSADNKQLLKKFNLTVDHSHLENYIEEFFKDIDEQIKLKKDVEQSILDIDSNISIMISSQEYLSTDIVQEKSLTFTESVVKGSSIETLINNQKDFADDFTSLSDNFGEIKKIAEKYELSTEISNDIELLEEKINIEIKKKKLRQKLELKLKEKNNMIEKKSMLVAKTYNASLGKRVEEYDKQIETFSNSITNILKNLKDIIRAKQRQVDPIIDKSKLLDCIKIEEHEYFRLQKKIETKVSLDNLFSMLQSSIGNKPKINKSNFTRVFLDTTVDFSDEEDVSKLINIYIDHNEEISFQYTKNCHSLVDYDIEIKTIEDGFQSIEKVTAGNLAKIYISYMFEKEIKKEGANVLVLYDQPEANMEKKFIYDILSDKIKDLRLTSQVIIATHEPLLVVNADANQIILSQNDKLLSNENSISYENISFVGTKSKSEIIENLANLIDGSPSAINKRNKIYGGLIKNEQN